MISLAWMLLTVAAVATAEDVVRFDFETGDLQGWQVVEGQFDYVVSDRPMFHNRYPDQPSNQYNKQGRYYLSTVEQQPGKPSNDRMTGVIESPVFVLAGPEISMLVGSGTQPGTYVALCTLDGQEVLVARGKDQTEVMQRVRWDATQWVGQKVFLRVVDRETGGWGHVTLDDFSARGRIDAEETQRRFAEIETRLARQRLQAAIRESNLPALRRAIADLMETMPDRYPRGAEFLARLDALEERLAAATPEQTPGIVQELEALRREALVANPLVGGQPLVFVVRHQYRSHYHAIDTLFHTAELNADRGMTPHADLFQGGAALKTIDLPTGRVQTLLDVPDGVVRDPEVHFDGQRIVFALRRNRDEDFHIWEIGSDGTGLRQLTGAAGVSDFDPFYLPDERIVFSSTREPKYNQCSRDHGANLFCMEPDGANIRQVSKNNLFDNHGTLTPDGRILYARWEYVDRNFGDAHGVWTVNPDGTNQAIYWGNNTASPGAVYYPRLIPGTQQMLCVFGMHHFRLWGALAIVDRQRGLDGREPVIRTWPADAIERVRAGGGFDCDGFVSVYPKYECPYPLSDKYFLCSRMTMRAGQLPGASDAQFGEQMGIYLIDVFGNELLLHAEEPGCYDPLPLRPQPRPPVIPPRRDFENREGYFYVADVYRGTHMAGVPRGSVKSLRVVESPEKRHWSPGAWFGQGYTAPAMNWHSLENKRILGTVPVEEDGSASVCRSLGYVRLFPVAGRKRDDDPVDAERGQCAIGRTGGVRRLSRRAPHGAACVFGCLGRGGTAPGLATAAQSAGRLVRTAARVQFHGRGAAGVQPALRQLPRLRPRGRPETEPGPRPDADVQHGLHGIVAQRIPALCRRGAGRNPARVLVGLACQQAGPSAPHARDAGARAAAVDPGGVRPHRDLGRPERRLLSDLRVCVSGQPDRPHPAGCGATGPAGTADGPRLRPAEELRQQSGAGGELRPAGTQSGAGEVYGQERSSVPRSAGDYPGRPGAIGPPSPCRHAGLCSQRTGPAPRGQIRAPPRDRTRQPRGDPPGRQGL